MMPKKSKKQQDPYIRPIESEDKAGLSKDPPQDHPCSVPRGSRVAICAPPGHGKTCLAKHIAVYSRPFAAVIVIHGAGAMTKEWSKAVHTQTNFTQATPVLLVKHNYGTSLAQIPSSLTHWSAKVALS